MKAMARMAALAAALAFVSGCSHGMRHTNQQLKDQVKLPAAPMIEPSTSAPAGPGMPPPRPHPVREVRSQRAALIARARRGSSSSSRESPCADTLSRDVLDPRPGKVISCRGRSPCSARVIRSRTRGASFEILEAGGRGASFLRTLSSHGLGPLRSEQISVLQVNVGKLCNQTCRHCHVDAGPDRREVMSRETMAACLDLAARAGIPTVDITGGAPELNPHFRWLVAEARGLGAHVIDRCNLTILLTPGQQDLPEFLAGHQVEVVASLPCYLAENTDAQRGEGVHDRSIEALRRLNQVGLRPPGTGLTLTLVYNPVGPKLPPPQAGARGRLSPRAQGAPRRRVHPPLHDHQHADQPVP